MRRFLFILISFINSLIFCNSEKTIVYVSFELISIDNIDVKEQTFQAEFYLRLKWSGQRTAKNIEFLNSLEINKLFEEEWQDSINNISYKIRGKFKSTFDVSEFPNDKHKLYIDFGDWEYAKDSLEYFISRSATLISNDNYKKDWRTDSLTSIVKTENFSGEPFSICHFSIYISRHSISFYIKIIIPLIILMILVFINLFIPANQLESRINLSITSLLSMIALHFSTSGSLPDVNYPTLIDKLLLGNYIIVFLSLLLVVISFRLHINQKINLLKTLEKYSKIFLFIITISYYLIIFSNLF